ncbi:hypothetical protein [Pseudomonas fluorescens]|uniref:hypothetical protein n=1 Tax=Pseudomonas fluorescens TaxID=294 RepID=UPI001BEA4A60|nr:hypothetical protein [Pseudomonas fluorescens]MBT2375804.1 hypothetical protein [Pseudomonas fluorescens]
MQVHVITGQQATGKTVQLRAIQTELKEGLEVEILSGNSCTTPYFLERLKRRAASGAKYFWLMTAPGHKFRQFCSGRATKNRICLTT